MFQTETIHGYVLSNNGTTLVIQPTDPPSTVDRAYWKPLPVVAFQADSQLSGPAWSAIGAGARVSYQTMLDATRAANVQLGA